MSDISFSQDAGHGKITAQSHNNQVIFPVLAYTYPLKLLSPRMQQEGVGVVYMMTYGGGLVGGDHISLSVNIEHDVRLVLLSQVRLSKGIGKIIHTLCHPTGIYKSVQNQIGRQSRCPLRTY